MVEWWTKAHDLLVQIPFTQKDLEHVVSDSSILLRDGCDMLLRELHDHKVPVLIFSAGIGDIIERVMRQQSHMYSNIKIVSNYMDFDNEGTLIGFKGDIIHIFNKNEGAIHRSDYFLDLAHRENIILLGDSMGDLRMADGAVSNKNLLKIGFLNDKIESSLPMYMDAFDIVLVGEESLDLVNSLLRKVITTD
ncbi:hypothetical protein NP493_186g00009 [Ridgeia piscesae]|uniref:5'-nucleotidase n=1 Tax=Ridgeia piscesae TaxID=27915 RepID=A0AAD9P2C8_RIDPI|nr:hypothetical protein NP493_186g00009 [Ridgeia piscesae]